MILRGGICKQTSQQKVPGPSTSEGTTSRHKTWRARRAVWRGGGTFREVVPSERGSILIAILGMVAMLSVFVVAVNRQVSQEMMFGRWLMERQVALGLAKAGVARVLYEIQDNKIEAYDAQNENWASNETVFSENKMGEGSFRVICNAKQGYAVIDEGHRFGACDESARLSLNKATVEQLKNLFRAVGAGDSGDSGEKVISGLAEAVIDWRDEDDSALPSGAESNYYKSLSKPYEARNGPFESVEELQMVKGMTSEIYEKVKPFVTVYTNGSINFNTAPSEVMQALGLSPALADKVEEFRQGADLKDGTKDDQPFQYTEGITPAISVAMPFSPEEFAQISNAIASGMITVKSDVYRIYSIGRLIRGTRVSETRVTAVVKREGSILYWSEN